MRDLARRLLALEAARVSPTDAHESVRVFEKLRISLVTFAGADGFMALLRRAVVLARSEFPSLKQVKIDADGHVEDLAQGGAAAVNLSTEAAAAITAHLLELLATFIGEPLTLRLLREIWPDEPLNTE